MLLCAVFTLASAAAVFAVILDAAWWGASVQTEDYLKVFAFYIQPLILNLILYGIYYSRRGMSSCKFIIMNIAAYLPLTAWTAFLINLS